VFAEKSLFVLLTRFPSRRSLRNHADSSVDQATLLLCSSRMSDKRFGETVIGALAGLLTFPPQSAH